MKVFVTGATGFIGSAVVQELIHAGHQVLGLARSDAGAEKLIQAGALVHQGSLDDLESLRRGAAAADGVIHLAFIHDFSKFAESGRIDKRAIEAIGAELAGSGKPMVVTSGIAGVRNGKVLTENLSAGWLAKIILPRKSEEAALSLVPQGVNVSVVRLPPAVHGDGKAGFASILIRIAREKGLSAYAGKGLNRWSSVHRLDAAHLFRLALEKGEAGAVYHGVADEGVSLQDIASVIGRGLNLPVASKPASHFGGFGFVAGMNCPASSQLTQERLGWIPEQPGLLSDLEQGSYFERNAG